MTLIRTLPPLFLAAFIAALTPDLRAAIPPAEKLLPSDTLFVVTAPDCSALRAALKKSPQWRLWNDPAMRPFHDRFDAQWQASFVGPLERELGLKLDDFTGLPQGQLTFAVTQNGWNATGEASPGVLLLLDTKGNSAQLKTNLAVLEKKWAEAGKSIRTETLRGIRFSVVPLSSNDLPAALTALLPQRTPVAESAKPDSPQPRAKSWLANSSPS